MNVLRGPTVLNRVTRRPNWQALRQRLGACIVASVLMALFLGVWQFLVPGRPSEAGDRAAAFEMWAWIAAFWLCLPSSLVFATSASRLLWRERRRAAACLPLPGFLACAIGSPMLADFAGAAPVVWLWAIPAGLLISAGASVAVIVRTPVAVAPAAAPEDAHDLPAYARDVRPHRRRESQ